MLPLYWEREDCKKITIILKLEGRNFNNLHYADDTKVRAENPDNLQALVMKVKEHNKKIGAKINMRDSFCRDWIQHSLDESFK